MIMNPDSYAKMSGTEKMAYAARYIEECPTECCDVPERKSGEITRRLESLEKRLGGLADTIEGLSTKLAPVLSESLNKVGKGDVAEPPCSPIADRLRHCERAVERMTAAVCGINSSLDL